MSIHQLTTKLYSWASVLEESTRTQALQSATMPFIFPHLALMPDAHLGKGATVGSVIPTLGAIIPARSGSTSVAGWSPCEPSGTRSSFARPGPW
jgi:tRNA-splicing ligase RtcB (3'-phosphate/5'-hydroxy nucleic acid ligase)